MKFACVEAKCPVKGKTTPMEISSLLSSICGAAGWIICDTRSQAEMPIIIGGDCDDKYE